MVVAKMPVERMSRLETVRTRSAGIDRAAVLRFVGRPYVSVAGVTVSVDRNLAMRSGVMSIFVLAGPGQSSAWRAEDQPGESRQAECVPGVRSGVPFHVDVSLLDAW